MSGADAVTGAVCVALTGLGLVIAAQTARKRRFLGATRWTGLALLPLGLYLTGVATLARRVADAAVDWATGLAFGAKAWGGVAILVFAVTLLLLARLIGGRSRAGRTPEVASRPADPLGGAGRPGSGRAPRTEPGGATAPRSKRAARADIDDEFAEIEEILRRRGI